jgi:hypothetical protein
MFTVPIQDLRDVPGDTAVSRRTTPILIGDLLGMIFSIHPTFHVYKNASPGLHKSEPHPMLSECSRNMNIFRV